jgi:hypothetical protein
MYGDMRDRVIFIMDVCPFMKSDAKLLKKQMVLKN